MIYCVVPEPLADELYREARRATTRTTRTSTVIVDRREFDRRARHGRAGEPADRAQRRIVRDRRRATRRRRPAPAGPRLSRRRLRARRARAAGRVKLVVHVDGGARGNPGPAAAAAVISDARRDRARPSAPRRWARPPTTSPSTARCCSGSSTPRSSAPARSRWSATPSWSRKQVKGALQGQATPRMRPLHAQRAGGARAFRAAGRSVPSRAPRTRTPTRSSTQALDQRA